MQTNEEAILEKWEPKVHSLLRTTSIRDLDYEDIAQELRISILKAHKKYDPNRGEAAFGTYLHVTMLNVIRGLINQAKKKPMVMSLDRTYNDGLENEYTRRLADIIADPVQQDEFDIVELNDLTKTLQFSEDEQLFIRMKLDGFKLNEITPRLQGGKTAAKVRESIRQKVKAYVE